mgnify:CR=1 FL=1
MSPDDSRQRLETATLGGGCFWCLEAVYDELRGVASVESGYMGGELPDPTYEQVCAKNTGHAEVIQITGKSYRLREDDVDAHALHRHRLPDPPDERLAERRPAGGDLVHVAALDGVVAGVELVRRLRDGADVDVGGELVVQLPPQQFVRLGLGCLAKFIRGLAGLILQGINVDAAGSSACSSGPQNSWLWIFLS